jgi:chorismate mutase / prephenate dehydratase
MIDELAEVRAQIDELDRRLVALLNRRAELGLRAGRLKATSGRPLNDPSREREVLARVAAANEGPLPAHDLLALYASLIDTIRRLEETQESSPEAGPHREGPDGQARID